MKFYELIEPNPHIFFECTPGYKVKFIGTDGFIHSCSYKMGNYVEKYFKPLSFGHILEYLEIYNEIYNSNKRISKNLNKELLRTALLGLL